MNEGAHRFVARTRASRSSGRAIGQAAAVFEVLESRQMLAVLQVTNIAASQGFGRFIGGVTAQNTFTATVQSSTPIDHVEFQLNGVTISDTDGSNGWQATYDMGTLSAGTQILVRAVGPGNQIGDIASRAIVAVAKPAWMTELSPDAPEPTFDAARHGYVTPIRQYTEMSFLLHDWFPHIPGSGPGGAYNQNEQELVDWFGFFQGKTGFAVETNASAFVPLDTRVTPTVSDVAHLDVYWWLWGVGWQSTKTGIPWEPVPADIGHLINQDISSNRVFSWAFELLGHKVSLSANPHITMDANLDLGYEARVNVHVEVPIKSFEWNFFKKTFIVKLFNRFPVPIEVRLDGGVEFGYVADLTVDAKLQGNTLTLDRTFTEDITFTPSLTASVGLPRNIAKVGVKTAGEIKVGIRYHNGVITVPAHGDLVWSLVFSALDGLFSAQIDLATMPLFDTPDALSQTPTFFVRAQADITDPGQQVPSVTTIGQTTVTSSGQNAVAAWQVSPSASGNGELYASVRSPQGGYTAPQVVGTPGRQRDGIRLAYMGATPVAIYSESSYTSSEIAGAPNVADVIGAREIFVSRYVNSTWQPGTRLTNNLFADAAPAVAFSADGQSGVAAWVRSVQNFSTGTPIDSEIYIARWNGSDWGPELRLTNNGVEDGDPIVTPLADGTFMVSWRRRAGDQDALPYRIVRGASEDAEDFAMISNHGEALDGAGVTRLSDDTLLFSYTRVRVDGSQSGTVELRDFDPDSQTWSNPVIVDSITHAPTQVAVAELDGVIAVAYAGLYNQKQQVFVTYANFNDFPNQHWTTPLLVTQGRRGFYDLSATAIPYAPGLPGGRLLLSYSGADRYGEGAPLLPSQYISEVTGENGAQMTAVPFAPDVVVSTIEPKAISAADLAPGKVRLRMIVENRGAGEAGACTLKVMNGAKALGTVAVAPLGVGEQREILLDVVAPAGTLALGATIDSGKVLTELDETNNTSVLNLTLGAITAQGGSGPDLVVTPTSKLPVAVIGGAGKSMSIRVANAGAVALTKAAVRLQVFVIPGTEPESGDLPAGELTKTMSISSKKSSTVSVKYVFPTTLPDGPVHIVVRAFRADGAPDANSVDNTAATAGTVFVFAPFVYFAGTFKPAQTGLVSLSNFSGKATFKNVGNTTFTGTAVGHFFASVDDVLDGSDIDVATLSFPDVTLKAGKSVTRSFSTPFTLAIGPGNYWFFFVPDIGAADIAVPVVAS